MLLKNYVPSCVEAMNWTPIPTIPGETIPYFLSTHLPLHRFLSGLEEKIKLYFQVLDQYLYEPARKKEKKKYWHVKLRPKLKRKYIDRTLSCDFPWLTFDAKQPLVCTLAVGRLKEKTRVDNLYIMGSSILKSDNIKNSTSTYLPEMRYIEVFQCTIDSQLLFHSNSLLWAI